MSNGSDRMNFEEEAAGGGGASIPAGLGFPKQGPAGTFTNVSPIPNADLANSAIALMRALMLCVALLSACDMPSGSGCLPGRDVSGWTFVEMSPQVNTKPVVSCGRTVGFDIDMPDGEHASTMWRIEKSMADAVGDPLRFSVELESPGAPAFQLRPSIESAARVELAYTEFKPAGSVRAVVPDRVAASPSSIRVLQLVFPMSGPYKGRVSNFDW